VVEVRASTGDNRLGGEDFNEVLVEGFCALHAKAFGKSDREDATLRERLREAAERVRRALTDNASATMSVLWKDEVLEQRITGEEFEIAAAALLARLREPVLRSLRDSGIRAEDLQEIVLVGGSTRMPVVRRSVTRMFGRFPSNAVHPDEAVAIGAAIQAGLKARDAALNEVVMTDVSPYTLGVDTAEKGPNGAIRSGIFSPIIERNTVVPASRVKNYHTLQDDQRQVVMRIFQGESRQVADNVLLGQIEVNVPAAPAGEVSVNVRFTYDINGLLEVDIHVPQTGERRELVITDDESMAPAELDRRRQALAALKQHPRDDDANRHALARAARCYENFLGDRRAFVGQCTAQFESVLDSQDPRAVEHARIALLKELDMMEGETWL
jgi:molecular chaperone HscC